MPATNGNKTSRSSTTTAVTAASIAIQNTIGRVTFIAGQCERIGGGKSKWKSIAPGRGTEPPMPAPET